MVIEKIIGLTERWEDPNNLLLGPILKGLSIFTLLRTGTKFWIIFIYSSAVTTIVTQVIDVYTVRHDLNRVLNNLSLTGLSSVCFIKFMSFVIWQSDWRKLIQDVSNEEIIQINKQDRVIMKYVNQYTIYTRVITVLYWVLVFITSMFLITMPLMKYLSSKKYRDQIDAGEEPLPQIMCAWFPFDNYHMPGYVIAIIFQVSMSCQGAGIVATYDMIIVAIMTYFKGQLKILRYSCTNIFEGAAKTKHILCKIRECHRHHNVLINQYQLFNSLVSPIMFFYVLICSMTICCSVVQFSLENITTSQKLFIVQYTMALVFQLFIFCWHGTEVNYQSLKVDEGVYNSDWWMADTTNRKQLLLLAGKLNFPFIFTAGPCAALCLPAFVDIMKGAYSFYTLFSQMHEDK